MSKYIVNQILYVEEPNTTADINSVVKFFCVAAIVFGVALVGTGSYGVFKNMSINSAKEQIPVIESKAPEATIDRDNDKVVVSVAHDKAIDKITFHWDDGLVNDISGNGRTVFDERIDLPLGKHKLYLTVIDIEGLKTDYQKEFDYVDETIAGGNITENVKPTIDLTTQGSDLKMTVRDETKLKYMTYKWNNDAETKIEAKEGENVIEKVIPILTGSNELTVIAEDASGNKQTVVKTYVTATKPKLTVTKEGNQVVIKATHENRVTAVKFNLNGQDYEIRPRNEHKEIVWKQDLQGGENKIKVTAYTEYDVDGQKTEVTEEFNGTFNN